MGAHAGPTRRNCNSFVFFPRLISYHDCLSVEVPSINYKGSLCQWLDRKRSLLQTAHLRASPGAPTHMVGGMGPRDDRLQLTGPTNVLGADGGRRKAGSARPMVLAAVSMDHGTRHRERHGSNQTMPIA